MKENKHIKVKKLNPIKSLFVSLLNLVTFKINFPKNYNGIILKKNNEKEFEIFRHIVVGDRESLTNEMGAIFIVRFKLSKMSVARNINFSLISIPFFIGLPGFKAKFWFLDRKTGWNQGVYQWKTEQDAINYSNSFAVDFMAKRSEINSISYEIIPNKNIYDLVRKLERNR